MHRAYSFYPLFPVPSDLSHEVNLDVSHMEGLRLCTEEMPDSAPDVLVVPSRLKHFSKVTRFLSDHHLNHNSDATSNNRW